MNAKFKVSGRVDNADGATIRIDRQRDLFAVRPKGRRREYVLPLHTVAEIVVAKVVKEEVARG